MDHHKSDLHDASAACVFALPWQAGEMPSRVQPMHRNDESTMLMMAVKQMLKDREIPDEAVNWIVQDIAPRLAYLDGRFPSDRFLAKGTSPIFAVAMRKALQEMLKLEIELYYEKHRSEEGVGRQT